jgi:hypothetical protein
MHLARLVELVDTSDLKSDSSKEYRFKSGNEYIIWFCEIKITLILIICGT